MHDVLAWTKVIDMFDSMSDYLQSNDDVCSGSVDEEGDDDYDGIDQGYR